MARKAPPFESIHRHGFVRCAAASPTASSGDVAFNIAQAIALAKLGHERGFVTYTNEAKNEMLGVPMELLRERGAVSREVAIAMAEAALERSRANIAVSITGFADKGDEPGLVHFGCARSGRATAHREEHFGDRGRGATRIACMKVAIEMMTEML